MRREQLAEAQVLRAGLEAQRRHVLEVVEALDEDQRRSSMLPSGWSPIGLVRHLTLSDERYWFHSIVGGEPLGWFPEAPGADWRVEPEESTDAVLESYRDAIVRSNEFLDGVSLDAAPGQSDPLWQEWGASFDTNRIVLVHVLIETAVHCGHLDASVELIDGRQRIVLD